MSMVNRRRNFNHNFNNITANKPRPEITASSRFGLSLYIRGFSLLIVCLITSQVYAAGNSDIEGLDPVALLEAGLERGTQRRPVQHKTSAVAADSFEEIIQQAQANAADIRQLWENTLFVPADETSEPISSIQEDSPSSQNISAEFDRHLRQARIGAPADTNDTQMKIQLQQIIQQLSSVEFKTSETLPKPLITVDAAPPPQSGEVLPAAPAAAEQPESKSKSSPGSVTEQTLQMLKNVSEHPAQLNNPLELAEILFHSGFLPEAAKCYQEALRRLPANEDQFQDKAWLLFQIGNCLQKADPQAAMQMYRQLITAYPESPWTDSAKAKSKLIDWYLNDKPETLLTAGKL